MLPVASLFVLALVVGAAMWIGPKDARGDEGAATEEFKSAALEAPEDLLPSEQQSKEALEEAKSEPFGRAPETDLQVAEELPHRNLDGEEARELVEGVFGAQLEEPAGIYDELEPTKFLTDNAAVVPASTLPEPTEGAAGTTPAYEPEPQRGVGPSRPVLIESTLPLRTENPEGEEEAVDLELESTEGSGGELQPENPLAELTIPAHLGEGISVGDVQVTLAGAAPETEPTNVEGQYAFYPNVARNTDLVVSPTPTGVDAMTDIRSAEAPMETTYELSLPAGAELKASEDGGAEVLQGGRVTTTVPPVSATDAAGESVPVELEVAGDDLRVVASPGPDAAYPILVDPIITSEAWYWSSNHDSLAAWAASTTQWTYCPVPYALWAGPGVPGLDLTAGCNSEPVSSGLQAAWTYLVPRYQADEANFKEPPTTWVYTLYTQGVIFLTYGDTRNYPELLWGIRNPTSGSGWWTHIHQGDEGELNNWGMGYLSVNETSNPADKSATMMLIPSAPESSAPRRDTFIGEAIVAVVDEAAPVIKTLTSPSGWMNTVAKPIPYEFEDTGLGVYNATLSYEGAALSGSGVSLGCAGTAISPCPRVATSGTAGAGKATPGNLAYDPTKLHTGLDTVTVTASDPMAVSGDVTHEAVGTVLLKVDHQPPAVSLSGALTEEEKLGTAKSEYPLTISAGDGTESSPQSGIAKVEVKVDGKKVTMANESAWNPGCATQNCSFSGTWTLKAYGYTVGSHEVEVVTTDAVGNTTTRTLEVDLGQSPPQTSFTTPHPTYENHEVGSIAFKATRGGTLLPGATFKCGLDAPGEAPTETCVSPLKLPERLEPGWHTLVVAATEKGVSDPTPARWHFNTGAYPAAPAGDVLEQPETGQKTASYYTLQAGWGAAPEGKAAQGVTGVTFEVQLPGFTIIENKQVPRTFEQIPAACVIDGQGHQVSWPIVVHDNPGRTDPVYLKVRGCPVFEKAGYPEKEIEFRAVFDGGEKVAGASAPVTTEFIHSANLTRVPTDAVEEVGPASVDLLTGAFSLTHTDISIPVPGYEANLEFTRVYKSTEDGKLPNWSRVLGGAWQPSSPLEAEGEGEAWSRIEEIVIPEQPAIYGYACYHEQEVPGSEEEEFEWAENPCPGGVESNCPEEWCEKWIEVPFQPREEWIELIDSEGTGVPFGISSPGVYVAPEYAKELKLTAEGESLVLAYPNGTHTVFRKEPEKQVWIPKTISYQATPGSMRLVYEQHGKELRLEDEIAPSPVECGDEHSRTTPGCRTLEFRYSPRTLKDGTGVTLLEAIAYWGPSGNVEEAQLVAVYGYTETPTLEGHSGIVLSSEADPRLPTLGQSYSYSNPYSNLLTSMTVPGQQPWSFAYEMKPGGYPNPGEEPTRLASVSRGGMTTTIGYEVPVSGAGAPYEMSAGTVATWGQTDLPVDATAIFPPNHVPAASPPHEYTGATIHYLDPEGHQVNVASPSPPGVSGTSIATSETNAKGDVIRELSPRARLLALESPESASASHQLDSHSVYNQAGTEMLESWGPLHQVRLESGESGVQARQHTVTLYDGGEPAPPAGTPPAYLPTKETVSTLVPATGAELEPKVTETHYDWRFREPSETIVDPGGLAIRSVTVYNAAGQVIETRQPKGAAGGTAGDTKTIYWSASGHPAEGCMGNAPYANLPCKILPAAQATGTGRPNLLVKSFPRYNYLDEPTQVVEYPEGSSEPVRRTVITRDLAGRQTSSKVTGGGIELARTEASTKTIYNSETGIATGQEFVCEKECTGFDSQATSTTYNNLGQVTRYVDADGAETKTTYDAFGRPSTVTDPKGTGTMHYDETSGVTTSLEVSGVGTFTAAYDADGDLIRRGLPNGLTANTTYNVADEPTKLTYTKESSCGSKGCTWFEESLERSAEGRILAESGTQVKDLYRYDKAGRLEEAQETPNSSLLCTSRLYTFDADSNRLTKTTRPSAIKGAACPSSGGNTQKYEYDNADRLIGPTYDAFGRITSLPAEFTGGKAGENPLETLYFANNMVAYQKQNGVSNTFQLDSTGRQRQREQTGGVAGVEILHYDGPGDSPSWTALGSTWSRNIVGIGGELAAVQQNSGTTTFELTDLHGDVVATASSSSTATALLSESRFSEFGEPQAGNASARFGWLGGKSRRTELQSGVIQMGARSYIPQLGRFLTPDPIPSGSANAYDYGNQDPVNSGDPTGLKPYGRNHGFIHAGIHIWSPKGRKGGTHGTMKARLFTRMECHTCGPTKGIGGEVHVASVKVTIERGVGSGNIVGEHPIKSPTLEGEMPWAWENWNKGPPIEFACDIGQEYKVTLAVIIGVTFGRTETESVSAEEVCGHGRY